MSIQSEELNRIWDQTIKQLQVIISMESQLGHGCQHALDERGRLIVQTTSLIWIGTYEKRKGRRLPNSETQQAEKKDVLIYP